MDIREFNQRFDHVSGPNKAGEYTMRCPCHDDKTASLTARVKPGTDGRLRIFLCCHAGCSNDSILAQVGLKPVDLIIDPEPPKAGGKWKGKAEKKKPAPAPKPTQDKGPEPPAEKAADKPKVDWAHPDAVYSYTDVNGKELFQVVRYPVYKDGKRDKTFRQRHYDPKDPKANRQGYVGSVSDTLRDNTLYKMPELAAAIREGRPVYVVEGEKDVETLLRLGHTATCNPGGAGKWRSSYSRLLAGADVIILPDNDTKENNYTGQNHALDVALKTKAIAKRVRLVDIKEACPDLPAKGDISDMVQIMGDQAAMEALARQVAATRDFDPGAVPFWLNPMEQANALYSRVPSYGVVDGCIAQITPDSIKALTDFVVIPRMELTRDDGVNTSMWFVLDGWDSNGHKLDRATISAKELDAMNWVTGKWGFRASLAPGTSTKDKVAWAIKQVGKMTAKRVTEYGHTGWRQIGGKWCYLYHGGAVGMEGVSVDMGVDKLKSYRLDGSGAKDFDKITYRDAIEYSMSIQYAMKEEIGVALLGTAYLAPLREFMAQSDIVPAFALFLYGQTQTHKTTAAALAMAHYGNFHPKNLPASFGDTSRNIQKKAFLVKDMPLLVDDFHPVTSLQERKQMVATAQTLSRAFGDGADRGRLNADSTIKSSELPRSVAIITGEDLPAVGQSGLARFFIVDVDRGDIPVGKEMTDLQEAARNGYLQKAMLGYIKWLQQQTDGLPERLREMFLNFRQMCIDINGMEGRAPETVACILVGYAMMLDYFRNVGLFDADTAKGMLQDAHRLLTATSKQQARSMDDEKPTRIFLDSMVELMASNSVVMKDLTGTGNEKSGKKPGVDLVGYFDNDYYYLLPKVAFGCVSKLCREQSTEFPVSLKALYKHLRTDGILKLPPDVGDDTPTRTKRVDGKLLRVLWIPRNAMDGPKAETEQLKMSMNGFQEVNDPDNPF